MSTEMTKADFQGIAEAAGLEPKDIRYDYSGRRMYGRTCPGITGHASAFGRFIAVAGMASDPEHVDVWALVDGVCTDSMGLETIYYWPDLELTE